MSTSYFDGPTQDDRHHRHMSKEDPTQCSMQHHFSCMAESFLDIIELVPSPVEKQISSVP
jgi:hypothetical protein